MLDRSKSRPDLNAAKRHLELLAGTPDPVVAWQVFDDSKRDSSLAAGFHGTLQEVLPRLRTAQRSGCGIYIAVNQTDGKGRRQENMRRARALFLDLDGAPLPGFDDWPVSPDLIICSSATDGVAKYQCWWFIKPTKDWDKWQRMQKALALKYGGDLKCTLTTQVGRCAGFFHLKRRDRPWRVEIDMDLVYKDEKRWNLDYLIREFGFDLSAITTPARRRELIDRPPPVHGWDNDLDVVRARQLLADERNWSQTSDGAFSIFKMACRLRDLGISKELAIELIEETAPALPPAAEHDPHYVEKKVANPTNMHRAMRAT